MSTPPTTLVTAAAVFRHAQLPRIGSASAVAQ
jgi:hypothetical protein